MCSAERRLADQQHVASVRLTRNQYHKSDDERRLWHAAREQTYEVRERSNEMKTGLGFRSCVVSV